MYPNQGQNFVPGQNFQVGQTVITLDRSGRRDINRGPSIPVGHPPLPTQPLPFEQVMAPPAFSSQACCVLHYSIEGSNIGWLV